MFLVSNASQNGTSNPQVATPNTGWNFMAWGTFGGASITLSVRYQPNTPLIPIHTFTAPENWNSNPIISSAQIVATVSNASSITDVSLAGGITGVYQIC